MGLLTLKALERGIHGSDEMRELIAAELGMTVDSRFTNLHAWALVDLQATGKVRKRGLRDYVLAIDPTLQMVPAPSADSFPQWARIMVGRANRSNKTTGPVFTAADLVALWDDCGGRCSVTRLAFSFERIGSSLVKRAYAPSLDRIIAGKPYSRENCRLVMVAVNFAMNAWGLDVYLRLARAAVRNEPEDAQLTSPTPAPRHIFG